MRTIHVIPTGFGESFLSHTDSEDAPVCRTPAGDEWATPCLCGAYEWVRPFHHPDILAKLREAASARR